MNRVGRVCAELGDSFWAMLPNWPLRFGLQMVEPTGVADGLTRRFGKRRRERRSKAKLMEHELGRESGLHITFIARLEAGERDPR